ARERFFPNGTARLSETIDSFPSSKDVRAWLVREVHGLGLKEASHFLRNTGRGEDLAILDRHILRNLIHHGVLRRLPRTLTAKRYLEIEARMEQFSREVGIPMAAHSESVPHPRRGVSLAAHSDRERHSLLRAVPPQIPDGPESRGRPAR